MIKVYMKKVPKEKLDFYKFMVVVRNHKLFMIDELNLVRKVTEEATSWWVNEYWPEDAYEIISEFDTMPEIIADLESRFPEEML